MVRKLGSVQHGDSKILSPEQVAEMLGHFNVPGRAISCRRLPGRRHDGFCANLFGRNPLSLLSRR